MISVKKANFSPVFIMCKKILERCHGEGDVEAVAVGPVPGPATEFIITTITVFAITITMASAIITFTTASITITIGRSFDSVSLVEEGVVIMLV